MGLFSTVKSKITKSTRSNATWDMKNKESREAQVKRDYEYAKEQKMSRTEMFIRLDEYYNNQHYSQLEVATLVEKNNLHFLPPVLPDPYIQVESMIDPYTPDFEFKGRDDDQDNLRAKQREYIVKFICYRNKLSHMNPDNERRLNKLGNAFWKVSYDGNAKGPGYIGEIIIGDPNASNIFPDPAAYDIDDCEYLCYVYRLHWRKARRTWGKVLDDIPNDSNHAETEIFTQRASDDDTVQVVEYWYRDDEGDIACSICVNGVEVQFIKKYWANTRGSGTQMYPFVKYCKIPMDQSFWDKSEIETILDLVDAGDREFMTAIMNDAFCANDIVLIEQGALAPGQDGIPNHPGGQVTLTPGHMNGVARLGGLQNNLGALEMVKFIHDKIQETNGNFAAKGSEPIRITTASGFAQLREDREARSEIKKMDRIAGFERLYNLIDLTALEFYNTDRIIMLRGEGDPDPVTGQPTDIVFTYNSDNYRVQEAQKLDAYGMPMTDDEGNELEQGYYYPDVDTEINVGQGISRSKAFTLQATKELLQILPKITPETAPLVIAYLDILDLPNKQQIKDSIDRLLEQQRIQTQLPPGQGQPGQVPEGQIELDQIIQQLPADMQDELMNMPPEEQQQFLEQMMQGG